LSQSPTRQRAYSRGAATSTGLGLLRLAEDGEAHVKTGLWPERGLLVVKVATMCQGNLTNPHLPDSLCGSVLSEQNLCGWTHTS
jgi:hypothetical protein